MTVGFIIFHISVSGPHATLVAYCSEFYSDKSRAKIPILVGLSVSLGSVVNAGKNASVTEDKLYKRLSINNLIYLMPIYVLMTLIFLLYGFLASICLANDSSAMVNRFLGRCLCLQFLENVSIHLWTTDADRRHLS